MRRAAMCESTQGSKRSSHLAGEKLRLFPRSEVTAFVELVVVDKLGIGLLCPASRSSIDFVGEGAHGHRDLYVSDVEEAAARRNLRGVPVEACRGNRGVRQPIE